MNSITRKILWLSALGLIAGLPILEPKTSFAQERGERLRSIQSSGNRNRQSGQRTQENRRDRFDPGRMGNDSRWNGSGRQWNNGFADNERDRHRDRDRGRDRDRDRDRHRRDRDNYSLGLFWRGTPYSNYYPYDYGGQGFYGPAYGYDAGNPYDLGYSDGFSAGRFDRMQGNLYNPRQYERSGDPDYFEGFVAGYQDGYRR